MKQQLEYQSPDALDDRPTRPWEYLRDAAVIVGIIGAVWTMLRLVLLMHPMP